MPTKKPGGVFTLSSQMWEKELSDHHKKVMVAKATIPSASAATPRRAPAAAGSAKNRTKEPRNAGGEERAEAEAPSRCLDSLSATDRRACDDVIVVLEKMSSVDSKALLEEIFVTSEMRKLLSRYTGVYPSLDPEDSATPEGAAAGEPAKGNQQQGTATGTSASKAAPQQKPTPPQAQKPAAQNMRRHSTGSILSQASSKEEQHAQASGKQGNTSSSSSAEEASQPKGSSSKQAAKTDVGPVKQQEVEKSSSTTKKDAEQPPRRGSKLEASGSRKGTVPVFLQDEDAEEDEEGEYDEGDEEEEEDEQEGYDEDEFEEPSPKKR